MRGKIVFMGTPDFAVLSLDAIVKSGYEVAAVVTVPDRKSGRGQKLTFSPVKDYAMQNELPLLQPERLRDPFFLESLASLHADIFVVVAFRMLPEVVWSMPPMGTFNLHASLLPQYRGAAPINWALINGERATGVTTFMLNERIDEGQLLLQRQTDITEHDTAETLHDRLAQMGSALVVETLEGLYAGTIKPQQQITSDKLKSAPKLFRQDCAIDWNKSGEEIRNFVRGLSPYPAAYTEMVDNKGETKLLKIYDVAFVPGGKSLVGKIEADRKQLKIGVKDGTIIILSLQISGKKQMRAYEFLRGYNIQNWELVR